MDQDDQRDRPVGVVRHHQPGPDLDPVVRRRDDPFERGVVGRDADGGGQLDRLLVRRRRVEPYRAMRGPDVRVQGVEPVAVAGDAHVGVRTGGGEPGHLVAVEVDAEDRTVALLVCREEDRFAGREPLELRGPQVEVGCDLARGAVGEIDEHDGVLGGVVGVAELRRDADDLPAVGGYRRAAEGAVIRQQDALLAGLDVDGDQVGREFVGAADREGVGIGTQARDERAAVRGEHTAGVAQADPAGDELGCPLGGTAFVRCLVVLLVLRWVQGHRRVGVRECVGRHHPVGRFARAEVVVPVADRVGREQLCCDPRLLAGLRSLAVRREAVGFRMQPGLDGQVTAVVGDVDALDPGGWRQQQACLAAVGRERPQRRWWVLLWLRVGIWPRGHEQQRAVRTEGRCRLARRGPRQLAGCCLAVGIDRPERRAEALPVGSGRAHADHQAAAVGGEGQPAQAWLCEERLEVE
jgi:hypothetical protein